MRFIFLLFTLLIPLTVSAQKHAVEELWDEVFTSQQVRSPYLPVIFDLSYDFENIDTFDEVQKKYRNRAKNRQIKLDKLWKNLRAENSPKYHLLSYLFEEKKPAFLLKKLNEFPDELKFEAARLLIAECEFKASLDIMISLTKSDIKEKALNYLDQYQSFFNRVEDSRYLSYHDLSKYKKAKEEPLVVNEPLIEEIYYPYEKLHESDERRYDILAPFVDEYEEGGKKAQAFQGYYGAYLTEKNPGQFWTAGSKNEITLHTLYHGEVQYQLFKIDNGDKFKNLNPEIFKKLKPIKEWVDDSTSVRSNNSLELSKLKVKLPVLDEGHYVLTAKLKYCPFLMLKRIAVSSKIIFTSRNLSSLDVIVMDRRSFQPTTQDSVKIYSQNGNTSVTKQTDENGMVSLDETFTENRVYIDRVLNPLLTNTLSSYNSKKELPLLAVWTSAPLYKVGETVKFRGNIRLKGLRASLKYPQKSVNVRVYDKKYKTVWSKNLELTELGSFEGEFRLPLTAKAGKYTFAIDRQYTKPVFKVEAYRLERYKFKFSNYSNFHPINTDYKNTATLRHMNGSFVAGKSVILYLSNRLHKKRKYYLTSDNNGKIQINIPKKDLAINDINILKLEYRSPGGEIVKEQLILNYYEQPLTVHLEENHFPDETIYKAQAFFNMSYSVKPDKVNFLLYNEAGKLVKTIDSETGELIVKAKQKITKIKCTVTYKGYQKSIDHKHSQGEAKSDSLLSVFSKSTAYHGERINLHVLWNPKNKKEARAYIFAQNIKTHFRKVIVLKPGANSIPVKMDRNWGPNVYFNVFAFSPELIGSYQNASCVVQIKNRSKIKVKVSTDKHSYKPGEECTVSITCLNEQDQPLANSEVSLSVLNESLFKRAPEKFISPIFNDFNFLNFSSQSFGSTHSYHYTKKWLLGVTLCKSYYNWARAYGMVSRFGGGMSGQNSGYNFFQNLQARDNFSEIAAWAPVLVTDEEGKVSFKFKYPDTITNWIFDVKVMASNGVAGEAKHEAITDLKIENDFILPRIVRSGDKLGIPIEIVNRTDSKTAILSTVIRHNNKVLNSADQKEIDIPANSVDEKFIFIKTPQSGILDLKSAIKSAENSDFVSRKMNISPKGYHYRDVRYIGSKKIEKISLPSKGVYPETLKVEIKLESDLKSKVLNAMERLKKYRYGCAEQTISRFTPLIVVNKALKSIGTKNPYEEEMPLIIEKGLARLYRFQHADGGWLWYEHGKSSYRISTLVLEGLLEAHAQNIDVDEEVIHNGAKFVFKEFKKGNTQKDLVIGTGDRTSYQAYAVLSRYNYLFKSAHIQDELNRQFENLLKNAAKLQEKYNLCKGLIYLKQNEKALTIFKDISKAENKLANRTDIIHAGSQLELAAVLTPDAEVENKIFKILGTRSDGWWYDTRATHIVIRGLAAHLTNHEEQNQLEVYLNGKRINILSIKNKTISLKGSMLKGAELVIKNPGKNMYNAKVNLSAFGPQKVSFKNPQAFLLATFREHESQRPLNSKGILKLSKKNFYSYEIHFNTKVDLKYSRLSIPRPAGIELLETPKLKAGIVSFEEYDDSFNFFIDKLPAGTHSLTLHFRTDIPGEIFAPLPELDTMYGDPLRVNSYAPEKWIIK